MGRVLQLEQNLREWSTRIGLQPEQKPAHPERGPARYARAVTAWLKVTTDGGPGETRMKG
ncbi:hypothetical protein BCR44DRAFT_1440851 [Catenaria anguillulae PL171]|uniref:Uncharacterized protein n=1 Tax=Catenaria anguillulae PL171 TaxID=765915 RepID=A0A1Y2HEK2_9FUNG|nr:hypothetical protein BCR44DRAFT_1440851 [Catenaria anguillulae PL171]